MDSAFDSLVDADALEAELEECSELLPEVLWDELELPEELEGLYQNAREEIEKTKGELLDVLELDDSLLTVKVSVLLFTVQSL